MPANVDIRVWVAHSTTAKPTEDFRPHNDDIIVVYDPEYNGLSIIFGHQGDERQRLLRKLEQAIRKDQLIDVFGEDHDISNIVPGNPIQLSQDDWQLLRDLIIQLNSDMQEIIEELESAQEQLLALDDEDAIIFDAVRTAIQAFSPGKQRDVLDALDNIREKSDDGQTQDSDVIQQMREALLKADIGAETPKMSLTNIERIVIEGNSDNYDGSESAAIQRDFDNVGSDMIREYPDGMRDSIVRLRDPDSDRQLTIIMAHRRGANQTDLAASDLIYVNEAYRSIVFVQYKRRSRSDTVQINSSNDLSQHQDILSVCKDRQNNGCTNYSVADAGYRPEDQMRLVDCPVLYKFVSRTGELSPRYKNLPGDYMPSCLLHHLLNSSETTRRREIYTRAFPHSVFYNLLRRAQIGSRSEEYEALQQVIADSFKNTRVIAVETVVS